MMEVKKKKGKKKCIKKSSGKQCAVCSDNAEFCFYGAIVCDSCRAFFRRNVIASSGNSATVKRRCRRWRVLSKSNGGDYDVNGNGDDAVENENEDATITNTTKSSTIACDINVTNRKYCSKCRMDKCIRVGMKRESVFNVKYLDTQCQVGDDDLVDGDGEGRTKLSHESGETIIRQCNADYTEVDESSGEGGGGSGGESSVSSASLVPHRLSMSRALDDHTATLSIMRPYSFTCSDKYIQPLVSSILWDSMIDSTVSLTADKIYYTSEEARRLHMLAYLVDLSEKEPIRIPDYFNTVADAECILCIAQMFTERMTFVFDRMSLFPYLSSSMKKDVCKTFVPLIFIIRSIYLLAKTKDSTSSKLREEDEMDLLPSEIKIPVKVSFKCNPHRSDDIAYFLHKYHEVLSKAPLSLQKDLRIIFFTFIYLLYKYLDERKKSKDHDKSNHPHDTLDDENENYDVTMNDDHEQLKYTESCAAQLDPLIASDLLCTTQLFKKLATSIYGPNEFKRILKAIPDLIYLTDLFNSLTLNNQ